MYVPQARKSKHIVKRGKIDFSRISRGVIVTGKSGRHTDKRRLSKVNERVQTREDF